jgi:chitinase
MRRIFTGSMLAACCGLLGGCDNTGANPAERVAVESPSRQSALVPGVAPDPKIVAAASSRSDTYTDDFDADGIADTRTVQTWTFDPVGNRCTQLTEIDFEADGTIDARSSAVASNATAETC